MSKQSEIREGIAGLINLSISEDTKRTISNAIILYLHRESVVIKVDRKLPKLISLTGEAPIEEKSAYLLGTADCKEQFVKAGYVAVGSLIDTP